ncbi:unnamed protein product [Ophioblennius macclurei]
MAGTQEDWVGRSAERRMTPQRVTDAQTQNTTWSQTVRTLQPWSSLAPVGVVWTVCQLEALLHPSLSLLDVGCRLLLVGLLWIILGCFIFTLKRRLRPGNSQEDSLRWTQQRVVAEKRNKEHLCAPQTKSPGVHVPLAVALADSLLLCVLQEPLPDPRVAHIKALISRLKSVGDTLERAGTAAGMTLEEVDRGSTLTDRLKLICTYLQQRTVSLHTLVQVQGDFEASVKDMLQGLDGLWARLEELHTGVTITKEVGQGRVAVSSAQTDAETLFAVLGRYKTKLQSCEAHLKDSTQLLQELTWSHANISNKVSRSSESVWPEILLQSNIEQFDRVQECFNAVEQQTSTFRAHLEGLGRANQKTHTGLPAHTKLSRSSSVPKQMSPPPLPRHDALIKAAASERRGSTSSSRSVSSADTSSDTRQLSLYEKSQLISQQISSTLERLRGSGRKK